MDLKKEGACDTTIGGYRDIIHNYFGWLYQEGLVPKNPSANLGNVKAPKTSRRPFSHTEIERLKEACTTTRDKAILLFLLSSGCRVSEACALNRNDINLQAGEAVVFGKGAKERTVYINEIASMILRRYLDERTDSSPALFVGKGTERMTPGGIRAALKTLEERSGVSNVHPHRFRRTLATNLIDRGMSIQEVAAILGHERLDTTMKYVYISQGNVKNSYNHYSG
jgi:site-specific recombinase XerD